jgi:DNA-binding IclR family transcriptional regulator
MRTTGHTSDSDHVQSLERGLAVITAFSAERQRMTLSEVAKVTGLTRAAARRFLLTLQRLGYVTADDRAVLGARAAAHGDARRPPARVVVHQRPRR